ncbi:eukaryotic translation initiation factor 2A-like isoform X1 [Pecten maximus]|uniref:eukaryotic translation initiation factor 2A-like isoform X1 n=1 Tax=Pecten maximus TaxID=6579 RepID=UPI001457E83B|nr:eukaryotic translation initiation factor 2A-like isoform X1 [Pecten maximus]
MYIFFQLNKTIIVLCYLYQYLTFTVRGSDGIWMVNGPPDTGSASQFPGEKSHCRCMAYNDDGSRLGWCTENQVIVINTNTFKKVFQLDINKVVCMKFSPKGSVLVMWQNYSVNPETKQGNPNLHLYDTSTGLLLRSFIQKKQKNWDPNWTKDEGICCRNVNNELQFFENNKFDEIKVKLMMQKISEYSLASCGPPYVVAGYVPGVKGQPSFVRVYQYPNFGGQQAALASKSFFKSDTVTMNWNSMGSALLVLSSTETSEQNYYGDQGLHFISTRGEACLVPRSKNGPVYHVEWSPKGTEFCVVYGFMPAKATLYNLKSEPLFDFGTGPRNVAYFNPQGSILCLAGFGNLRGNLEFWDTKQRKLICQAQAPDTTIFQFHPDGEHFLTATTAPRLRVGNGYRIWHFTGSLLQQVNVDGDKELWEAQWQSVPEGTFPERLLNYKAAQAMAAEVAPLPGVKAGVYRPPQARGTEPSFKLHDYEAPSDPNRKQPTDSGESKSASKNKKKRDARKAKMARENVSEAASPAPSAVSGPGPVMGALASQAPSTGDPDKDKKARNLRKKLQAIQKLKEQKAAGKQLEINQIEKLKTEASLIEELSALGLDDDWS